MPRTRTRSQHGCDANCRCEKESEQAGQQDAPTSAADQEQQLPVLAVGLSADAELTIAALRAELAQREADVRKAEAARKALQQKLDSREHDSQRLEEGLKGLHIMVEEGQRLEEENARLVQELVTIKQQFDQQQTHALATWQQAVWERDQAFDRLHAEAFGQLMAIEELRKQKAQLEADKSATLEGLQTAFYNLSLHSACQAAKIQELAKNQAGDRSDREKELEKKLAAMEQRLRRTAAKARKAQKSAQKRERLKRTKLRVLRREYEQVLKTLEDIERRADKEGREDGSTASNEPGKAYLAFTCSFSLSPGLDVRLRRVLQFQPIDSVPRFWRLLLVNSLMLVRATPQGVLVCPSSLVLVLVLLLLS